MNIIKKLGKSHSPAQPTQMFLVPIAETLTFKVFSSYQDAKKYKLEMETKYTDYKIEIVELKNDTDYSIFSYFPI